MKKILLIVGLAFGCSSVYAQIVPGVIDQKGTNAVGSTLDLSGRTATNPNTKVNATQLDDYQYAKVVQGADVDAPGQENVVDLFQRNVGATSMDFGNFMTIMQSGGSQRINARQLGRYQYADLQQNGGSNNRIITSQSGERNLIVAKQIGGSFLKAEIFQGAGFSNADAFLGATVRNTARLTQSGQSGEVKVTQQGSAAYYLGTQQGGNLQKNVSTILQTNNGGFVADQDGDNNTMNATQNGNQIATGTQAAGTVNGVITINQGSGTLSDTRNTANVSQFDGNANQAIVDQTAATAQQNVAKINQAGTRRAVAGEDSKVTITQTGKSSTAEVDQLANSTFNTATVTQTLAITGRGSYAGLSQSGEANVFDATQRGNSNVIGLAAIPIGPGVAKAVQNGQSNRSTLVQDGQGNSIGVSQQGANSIITITQFTDNASGIGNKATAIQKAPVANSMITINQNLLTTTDENVATVTQNKGNLNFTTVTQDKKNTATVTQDGTDDSGNASVVNIDQGGAGTSFSTGGTATVTQADGTQGGDVTITQRKIGNKATVNQTAGRQNLAQVSQLDDTNEAIVDQSGTVDTGTGAISSVTVNQNSKAAYAKVTQTADGSSVLVEQSNSKDKNSAIIVQNGRLQNTRTQQFGDLSETTVTQNGQSNVARTYQTNLLSTGSPGNGAADHRATLTQSGTLNQSSIGQAGLKNVAEVTQSGQQGFAATAQYGEKNTAKTTQTATGPNNTANVAQFTFGGIPAYFGARGTRSAVNTDNAFGMETNATIQQVFDNVATLSQTGTGKNQIINVLQTGDMENANVKQTGSDNQATGIQAGQGDSLTTDQTGTLGVLLVRQFGAPNQSGNTATITDSGNRNEATVNQVKFNNTATITQAGSDNSTAAVGGGGTSLTQVGEKNSATINQKGNKGSIIGLQGESAGLTFTGFSYASVGATAFNDAFRNKAMVDQIGQENVITFNQTGDDGVVTVDQKGNFNTIGITQLNVGLVRSTLNKAKAVQGEFVTNSTINIDQTGRNNEALDIQQLGNGANNNITLTQTNDNNKAKLKQDTGNNNLLTVIQNTTNPGTAGGTVDITQTGGSLNEVRLQQDGFANTLTLTQTGNRNLLRAVGGGAGTVATQQGHDNKATLLQTGDDHVINLGQGGMFNTTTITQSSM